MTSPPKNHGRQPTLRRPLGNIKDRNAKARRETPLIKRVLRGTAKGLPPRPQTNTRQTTTKPLWKSHPKYLQDYSPDSRVTENVGMMHVLGDAEQFDRAVRIFTRLRWIPGLLGLSPRIHEKDYLLLRLELHYPNTPIWNVFELVRPNAEPHDLDTFPRAPCRDDGYEGRIRVHEIQGLRDALLHDIRILCASHIAFNSDVIHLHTYYKGTRFLPIIDAFDLNLCNEQDADAIDWTKLEGDMVRKIESQFQAFEVLAQLGSPTQPDLKLEPEVAFHIFKSHRLYHLEWPLVVQQVDRYAPELARYTLWRVREHLSLQRKRTSLPGYHPLRQLASCSNAVKHVLRLTLDEGVEQNTRTISDRAFLSVYYASLLVNTHAKVLDCNTSKGILQLDCPGRVEEYTSDEDFHLVTEACREAKEAIRTLYDACGEVDSRIKYHVRDISSAMLPRDSLDQVQENLA